MIVAALQSKVMQTFVFQPHKMNICRLLVNRTIGLSVGPQLGQSMGSSRILFGVSSIRNFQTSAAELKWEGHHRNFYHLHQSFVTGRMADKEAKKIKKSKMDKRPHMKGVILRLLVRKPRKPNSANRKCCKVRLSNGKEIIAYIPGEGHNLQEHNVVLIEGKGRQDLPQVHHKVVRGALDCAHVVKKTAA